jgi:hypothetical protein
MKGMCERTYAVHSGLAPYLRPCFHDGGIVGIRMPGRIVPALDTA